MNWHYPSQLLSIGPSILKEVQELRGGGHDNSHLQLRLILCHGFCFSDRRCVVLKQLARGLFLFADFAGSLLFILFAREIYIYQETVKASFANSLMICLQIWIDLPTWN